MCLVGSRRSRSPVASLTAASLILADRDGRSKGSQDDVRTQPKTMTDQSSSKTKRTFDEQELSNQPSYSRQITTSPEPLCYKKRKPSLLDDVDSEIKNTTTTTSSPSAFLLVFPVAAESTVSTDGDSCLVRPLKRARTLSFRKSSTAMTYESVKSSLFSCDMLLPSS